MKKTCFIFRLIAIFLLPIIIFSCGRAESKELEEKNSIPKDPVFYEINDIIVNPAETMGKRFAVTSMAFELKEEQDLEKIKQYDAKLKDIINTTLAQKTVEELTRVGYKDVLKSEILMNVKKSCPQIKVSNIYITKYVIQ